MSFFKRLWGYIKTLFRTTAERAMDPEIEIEQAIQEARSQDQKLRNQAAKIIAHRTQIEAKIERAADEVGEAREMAKQSLMKAEGGLDYFKDLPILILWGGKDFCFDRSFFKEWKRRYPKARSIYLESAGHYVLEDASAEVEQFLEGFLAEYLR